jgi:hypothetical protein
MSIPELAKGIRDHFPAENNLRHPSTRKEALSVIGD